MEKYWNRFRLWIRKYRPKLAPTQIIAIVFALIILIGALLLNLPVSARDGVSCGLLPAFFTATSATCVTGLVLFDTWSQWSGFGQTVILLLIEIGGLGFMSAASLVVFLLRRKIGLKQRMIMAQALSMNDMAGVVRLQKWVLTGSLSVQGVGALVLFLRFWPEYGAAKAAAWGVFHSVSAFCNAGFDIFGSIAPGDSIITFNREPVVCITLMLLVGIGGLGFFVWEEVATKRRWRQLSVYSRLVLLTSGTLILAGAVLFCLLEWNNPATLGAMSVPQKILNGFFQSVTVRTAGFDSIGQAGMTDAGKALSTVLMFLGGSSGSTAGGVKTVTVFRRTIPDDKVLDAMAIASIVIALALFGGIFLCATSPIGFTDALYESVSALATVGLTAGVTPNLSVASQLLIILYMYFGRVGVLTISLGFLMGDRADDRFRYATTNLLIG